jgi:hypothetical protein
MTFVALTPDLSVPVLLLAVVASAYWYLVVAAESFGIGLGADADRPDFPD